MQEHYTPNNKHLTLKERQLIELWTSEGKSNRYIAKLLGKSHQTINNEIKRGMVLQQLASQLLNIESNIKDLLLPFQKGYYYNSLMGGSFSIKSVLPAIFPNDKSLDYKNLELAGKPDAVFARD